jgi:hypothetical protein
MTGEESVFGGFGIIPCSIFGMEMVAVNRRNINSNLL